MTLITVNAVVHIPGHVLVLEVRRIVIPMASGALENGVIVRVRVACRANVVGIPVTRWERRVLRVVEGRSRPGRRVVAVLARGREELRLRRVSGIGCVVVIRLVAPDTRRRQRRVIVVHVAVGADARRNGVRSRQRKRGVVVIER